MPKRVRFTYMSFPVPVDDDVAAAYTIEVEPEILTQWQTHCEELRRISNKIAKVQGGTLLLNDQGYGLGPTPTGLSREART